MPSPDTRTVVVCRACGRPLVWTRWSKVICDAAHTPYFFALDSLPAGARYTGTLQSLIENNPHMEALIRDKVMEAER